MDLLYRIADLVHDFAYRLQSKIMSLLGMENDAEVEWIGYTDSRTCDVCDVGIGQIFKADDSELPRLPTHPNCRCSWRLIPKKS